MATASKVSAGTLEELVEKLEGVDPVGALATIREYNQAVQDARAFLQTKLDDLDGELYEPEEPR